MDTPVKKKRATTVTRRYGGIDAAERRKERQGKLVEAGLEIFGTRGYHQATVRDLCAQAGLTERYFYEAFKTVGELFDTVYAELRSQLQQRMMTVLMAQGMKSQQPMALGESTLRAWYEFLREDPRRARVMLIDAVSVSDSSLRGVEAAISEFSKLFKPFVAMLYPSLAETGFDVDVMVTALTGATIYIAKDWVRSGFKMPLDDLLRHNMAIYSSLDALYQRNNEGLKSGARPASLPHAGA